MAAGHRVGPARWETETDLLFTRVAPRFPRSTTLRRARAFALGLLAELPRKNCWTLAEHAGDPDPHGMQYLLARAVWDTDGMRDDLRGYVTQHLGDPSGVLVVDETGDLKKGTHTAGVQRQYTGTAGRIENAQVAVYLTYAGTSTTGAPGHAMIDRELYLPKSWTQNPERCAAAGIPDDIAFATKPALATTMLARALDAGIPASWVTGDEVYGADPHLRAALEDRQVGYVLAIGCNRQVPTALGPVRADALIKTVPKHAWQHLSAGPGAKGHRFYDWALIDLPAPPSATGRWWLLARRNHRTSELAFYRCYAPRPVPLLELVRVAGRRWTVEESFQAAKGLTGLDQHQVRRWLSWRRWTLLAMLAHALLAVLTATEHAAAPPPDGMIPLTCNEIARLFNRIIINPTRRIQDPWTWATWRRRHQHRAQTSHYQRQHTARP
ncbi:IS701 family transposase [Cryptosporangium sp. NPDC051539]|uniref:IS701 family transposase n=1 Tax=Cryptosporangium sp. NPDC051539 TaxID=3363962 RepID=UPI003796E2ED